MLQRRRQQRQRLRLRQRQIHRQRQRKDKTRRTSKTRSTTRESGTQDEVRQFTHREKKHMNWKKDVINLSLNFCFLTNSSKRVYDVQNKHLKKGKCCEATELYEHRLYSFIGPITSGDKSKSINLRYNLVLSISSCGVSYI